MSAISRCRVSLIGNAPTRPGSTVRGVAVRVAAAPATPAPRTHASCSGPPRWPAALRHRDGMSPATVGVLIGRPTDGATHQWAKTMSGS